MNEAFCDLRKAKRSFSRVGLSFTTLVVTAFLAQLLLTILPILLRGEGNKPEAATWWKWVVSFAPMYLLAFPACYLVMKNLPDRAIEKKKLSKKQFLMLIPICFCLMYLGNLLGTLLSELLSWGNAENALDGFATDQSPLKILVMVILAPVFEELICRKLLIDRTCQFGEKNCVLLSGMVFGLLHQNLYQFFYAFALGCVFAYVYIRTGCLRYPLILHMLINFVGAVVAPFVLSNVDMGIMESLGNGTVTRQQLLSFLPGFLLMMVYSTLLMGLSVFGFVLILIKRRRITWKETPEQLPEGSAMKTTWLNAGMIIYTLLCLVMMVLALFYTEH